LGIFPAKLQNTPRASRTSGKQHTSNS